MREFRAWEKNLKEMIPVHNIDFENKMINKDGIWRMFHEIVLMQYTGFKDKNKRKVYEADIVKNKFNEIFVVGYDDDFACFVLKTENGGMEFLSQWYIEDTDRYGLEVIGNIFEKELS